MIKYEKFSLLAAVVIAKVKELWLQQSKLFEVLLL